MIIATGARVFYALDVGGQSLEEAGREFPVNWCSALGVSVTAVVVYPVLWLWMMTN